MSTVAVDLPVPACVTHLAGNREEQGSSEISTMPPILFPVYTGTDEMVNPSVRIKVAMIACGSVCVLQPSRGC
jgi:hypothetical protein